MDMNEEAETEAIEKWLRMVDKPLEKKGDNQDGQPREESGNGKMHNKHPNSQVQRQVNN